ncbi:hypothetical protein Fmac_007809 [Flemingia macrophylla]|uniref:Uncharacterized protein n=1 Tax=Flemingia macrophylla TaxID=520843 RepID=A0ABD1MVP3_9FABA
MELEDLAIGFDWSQIDILNTISPTLLNSPSYDLQQVNNDSIGNVDATPNPNQALNTEHAFDFPEEITTSSNMGNPPQHAELISDGASSLVEGQNMDQMNYYNCNDQFSAMQNNNLPALMNDLGQQNEHNTSNQLLVTNVEAEAGNEARNGHCMAKERTPSSGLNNHHAINLNSGNENINGHFMTNQTSPLCAPNNHGINSHAINPNSGWNSPRSLWMQDERSGYKPLLHNNPAGFQQQGSTLNGPTTFSSTLNNSSALNSAVMGISGAKPSEGSSSQVLNMEAPQLASVLRPERAPRVQLNQVNPLYMVTVTPQRADNGHGLPISSSFGAQSSASSILGMLNHKDRSTVTSYGTYSSLQQNSSLNMPYERQREPPRRGRPRKRFEPCVVMTLPYKRRKKGSARENPGKSPLYQANNTPAGGVVQNANGEVASKFVNAMYDPKFEKAGFPIDPLLRSLSKTSHGVDEADLSLHRLFGRGSSLLRRLLRFVLHFVYSKQKEKNEVEDEEGREAQGENKGDNDLDEGHGFSSGFGGSALLEN